MPEAEDQHGGGERPEGECRAVEQDQGEHPAVAGEGDEQADEDEGAAETADQGHARERGDDDADGGR